MAEMISCSEKLSLPHQPCPMLGHCHEGLGPALISIMIENIQQIFIRYPNETPALPSEHLQKSVQTC